MKTKFTQFSLRLLLSAVGTTIIAFGIVCFRLAKLGIDPDTAANIGVSSTFHWYLGNYQLAVNLILFLLVAAFDRTQFGLGTLINMSLPGYIIAELTPILMARTDRWIIHGGLLIQLVIFAFAMFCFSLGISIYMSSRMGVSPYDSVAALFEKKGWLAYRWVRTIQDVLFCVVALIFGGPLGIGTVLIAALSGYSIQAWLRLYRYVKKSHRSAR